MSIKVFFKETLLYFDTPQLFVACDAVGTNYLCMLVEQNEAFDNFICIQISERKLTRFCSGNVDLRDLFIEPEIKLFYNAKIYNYESYDFEVQLFDVLELPSEWLPEAGFFVEKAQSEIITESREKAKTIVHLSLNSPELLYELKINALTLSEALLRFQTMLKYAYKRSISGLSYVRRKDLSNSENYQLDVFAFAHGSFKVKMQSQACSNLYGETEIIKALHFVDELVDQIDHLETSQQILARNKGHFASSYISFIKFIADAKKSISYSWATSNLEKPITKQIFSKQAQKLYDFLNQQEKLKEDRIELVGFFDKVDETNGKWRLVDKAQKAYSGEILEDKNLTLKGVIIGTQLYKLVCLEKIMEIAGVSDEKKTLQLIDLTEINDNV